MVTNSFPLIKKMIKELEAERKGKKRAEQLQQEAEDEVAVFREARKRGRDTHSSSSHNSGTSSDDDDPLASLLQQARDKNAALEDNIFSFMCSIIYF